MHNLLESGPLSITAEPTAARPGRFAIQLITPGWGSSGYYSAEVLEAAAKAGVFPAGLQMYVDHPSQTEAWDRPERSIRDLGAVLVDAGRWDGKAIVAEAQVFSAFAGSLKEMRDAIGVSIRARGSYDLGEAEGRSGKIITELTEASSVDFVTQAGRGGRIIDVMESLRPSVVNAKAVGHGIAEATANDTRQALQAALADRLGGDNIYVWVCDFDAEQVWYELDTPTESDTWQLGYTITDDAVVTLADGEPVEVTRRTTYVPVSSTRDNTTVTEESKETPMEITEAEHRRLSEAAQALEEARTRAETAEAENRTLKANEAQHAARGDAEKRAKTILAALPTQLAEATQARLLSSVVVGLPMADGKLDVAAFESRVKERAEGEALYEAALLKERGAGTVSGHGGSTEPTTEPDKAVLAEADATLDAAFQTLGLNESQATIATAGRSI